jgi:hypothetical protein
VRGAAAGLCGLVAALLLPLALVSVWLHTVVADTEDYLARVDPLAAEERVRAAVEDVLVQELLQRVDVTALGDRLEAAVDAPDLGLPFDVPDLPGDLDDRLADLRDEVGPLLERAGGDATAAAEDLVRRVVTAVVGSDAFADLWRAAQQAGHSEVVSVLSSPDPLRAGEQVVVPLDVFVDAVRDQLAGLGLQLEAALDGLSVGLPLASADDLEGARVAYRVLERLWLVLPVAAIALGLLALALARRRLRVLGILGALAALLCAALLVVVGVARRLLLDASPSDPARVITARMVDAVSGDLRDAAVTGVLAGAAVVVVAFVLGLVVSAVRRPRHTEG